MPRDARSVTSERDIDDGGKWTLFWAIVVMAIYFTVMVLAWAIVAM